MLPNHAPLVVAEQFGTLEALHPGRIDLGLGRAPGTDQVTVRALRRTPDMQADTFPDDVVELINYLLPGEGPPGRPSPTPVRGYLPEVWLLGSSLFSAQLAGILGLPYSFAYHFAPQLAGLCADHLQVELPSLGAPRRAQGHGGGVRALCAERVGGPLAVGLDRPQHLAAADGSPGPTALPGGGGAGIRSRRPRSRWSKRPCRRHLIGDPEMVTEGLARCRPAPGRTSSCCRPDRTPMRSGCVSLSLIARSWAESSTRWTRWPGTASVTVKVERPLSIG